MLTLNDLDELIRRIDELPDKFIIEPTPEQATQLRWRIDELPMNEPKEEKRL